MQNKLKQNPSKFDGAMWQTYYDVTQETLLILLNELSVDYLKVKSEYNSAPPEKKKQLFGRLKYLEKIIGVLDEGYKTGRDYVGSMANSFYIEYKRLEASNRHEVEHMHQAYEFISERAIKLCERNISSPLKKVA
jgi:hypothetical protein